MDLKEWKREFGFLFSQKYHDALVGLTDGLSYSFLSPCVREHSKSVTVIKKENILCFV